MDRRSQKILFDTYWSAAGWHRVARQPTPEDLAYAKSKRMMFDPVTVSHDKAVGDLQKAVEKLTLDQVADAFLASLSTRRLDWRSALGSYSFGCKFPAHSLSADERRCSVCGIYESNDERDLSILNFERHKWGGVRHSDPVYASVDLTLFLEQLPSRPTAYDVEIFQEIVTAIQAVPTAVTSATLHTHLPKSLKSNKAERDQVIAILGICGILATEDHPGFVKEFRESNRRALPDRRFVDMAYPACWWTGSDGVNEVRLHEVFGHVL